MWWSLTARCEALTCTVNACAAASNCVVRRMFGAQVCSVVRWLFGCGLVGLLVVLIVPCFGAFVVLGDAGPLLLSPCATASNTVCSTLYAHTDSSPCSPPAPRDSELRARNRS